MGGQIALRGFERQEMLTAAVKLFAQLTGLPTTPSTPQTQQVSLGSVVSGTVKYDVSHLMTDGKMSFSMNNVTLGQQILPYIQSYIGIPSIVYMLGVYTVRFGQQGPLNDPVIQAQQYLGGGPTPRPTSKPIAPTRAPTFPTPTRIPTFAPSLRPTRVPTAMPTYTFYTDAQPSRFSAPLWRVPRPHHPARQSGDADEQHSGGEALEGEAGTEAGTDK